MATLAQPKHLRKQTQNPSQFSHRITALFNGIDKNIFRLVHQYELAKEVWDTLKTTHANFPKVDCNFAWGECIDLLTHSLGN